MVTYDLHQHLWPPALIEGLRTRSERPRLRDSTLQLPSGAWDVDLSTHGLEARLAALDRDGIDVAMIQTLTRRDTSDLLGHYGHVVVDECHHVSAISVEHLLRDISARHITGLTATPRRRDGRHPIIAMQCGPIRQTLTVTHPTETAVRRVLIERRTEFDPAALPTDPGIQEVLGAIASDTHRTKRIADDVLAELADGRFPLVLTERRQHLESLATLLEPEASRLVVLTGGMGVRARRRADELLAASDEPRVVLATGRYIGEGFDDG